MKLSRFLSIALLFPATLAFSSVCAQMKTVPPASLLPCPEELAGWVLSDSVRTVAGEELFTLIDGGADLYFEYGFRQAIAAEYRNAGDQAIKLELYEMSDDAAAFGRYSLAAGNRGTKVQIGNEGSLNEYYLVFWKSNFLVFLSTGDTGRESFAEILTIAGILDRNLCAMGQEPILLRYLPAEGLVTSKLVRGNIGLSSVYTFDTKNIFGVKLGVIGQYPSYTAFIFEYTSAKEAGENFDGAAKYLSAGKRFSGFEIYIENWTATDPKGARICAAVVENLIVIIIADQKTNATAISSNFTSFILSLRARGK